MKKFKGTEENVDTSGTSAKLASLSAGIVLNTIIYYLNNYVIIFEKSYTSFLTNIIINNN